MKTFRRILYLLVVGIIAGIQYDFTFMPYQCEMPIIELKQANVKEFSKDRLVFSHEKDEYVWKRKSKLFKNKVSVGRYPFLYFRKSHDKFSFEK